jgi:hypothetical protein
MIFPRCLFVISLLNLIDWGGGGPDLVPFYLSHRQHLYYKLRRACFFLKKSMQIRLDILYYKRDAASIRLHSLVWHVAYRRSDFLEDYIGDSSSIQVPVVDPECR